MAGEGCVERPLFGGAVSSAFPLRFQDLSNIRDVPDHQEAFADPSRDESIIFELLDLKRDVGDEGSAAWFLHDLAAEQDAESSMMSANVDPPSSSSNNPDGSEPNDKRPKDIGWKYGVPASAGNRDAVKCKFCQKICNGGIYRLKCHLAGISANVASCQKVPVEVRSSLKETEVLVHSSAAEAFPLSYNGVPSTITTAIGQMAVSKGRQGREAENLIKVYLANLRLKGVGTDILITVYEPIIINEKRKEVQSLEEE